MNARTQIFEMSMENKQVEEAVGCIFQTVMFHRSLGKFHYKGQDSYSVGTVGFEDVDCNYFDMTYLAITSQRLDYKLRTQIATFADALRIYGSGQISLEFFQKKKNPWPFSDEYMIWEVWTVRVKIVKPANSQERGVCSETLTDDITDKILYIASVMNRTDYTPKIPNRSELDLVFDTSYPDIQPYLFKISHTTSRSRYVSVGSRLRDWIRRTLFI